MQKRLFLTLTLLVLLATTTGWAEESLIGEIFQVSPGLRNEIFYRYENSTNPYAGENSMVTVLGELKANGDIIKKDLYIVVFETGEEAYTDKEMYDFCVERSYFKTTHRRVPANKLKKVTGVSAEAKFAEEQALALKQLHDRGIAVGKTVWLRTSKDGLAGVTKLKIKSLKLDDRLDNTTKHIHFVVDSPSGERTFTYIDRDVNSIAANFYTKNVSAKWSKKVLKLIEDNRITLGMTKEQVIASKGEPNNINRTVGSWGVHEQWVYQSEILYLENGVLKTWQD